MGKNVHPLGTGESFARIEARPFEQEGLIDRQGQLVRLIQTKKCPCIHQGKPDLFCNLCKGKGYILSYQRELEVIEELSLHDSQGHIYPFWNPVIGIIKVQRFLHESQGGDKFYDVQSFNDTTITLVNNGYLPRKFDRLKVSYKFSNYNSITNENCTHDGISYYIHATGLNYSNAVIKTLALKTSNPFNVMGDIVTVSSVYNRTQGFAYEIDRWNKQTILLKNTKPIPLIADVLETDYEYVLPFRAIINRIQIKSAIQKWGDDLKESDLECTLAGRYWAKRGNIITLMTTILNDSVIVTRGVGIIDELPYFDVVDVIENIIDQDGVSYPSINFTLEEYNVLRWTTSLKPAEGKRYSVSLRYHPSYIVYKQDISASNAEDKRFPVTIFLRLFNRFDSKQMSLIGGGE